VNVLRHSFSDENPSNKKSRGGEGRGRGKGKGRKFHPKCTLSSEKHKAMIIKYRCPDFGWDRADILHSIWCDAKFWL